jgi:nicotinamide-nucleotide amidase
MADGLTAAIIAVGSELLTPHKTDTNSLYVTEVLNDLGIAVAFKEIVGDNRDELIAHVAHALARHRVLILTGGLGPTDDDLTREAVAAHLQLPLDEDASIIDAIEQRFAARGWKMPAVNRRQAQVPRGATVLSNPHGTAPGLWIEHGELTYPVSEVTIAGHLNDIFSSLTPANDLEFRYGTNAPTVRLEGLTVAGT